MKRAFVYTNRTENDGKLVAVEDAFKDFLESIALNFNLNAENLKLYSSNGCEINDTRVIRDDEKVYLGLESGNVSETCDSIENSFESVHVSDGVGNGCKEKKGVVSDWITLNVGGKYFTTSRSTLLVKEPLSMLARMFADDKNVYLMNPSAKDKAGAYLIDRSPEYFKPILNYLRHGEVILDKHVNPKGVLEEAVFYGIDSMIPHLHQLIEESTSQSGRNQSLNRMDVIRLIIMTPTTSELRFQGVNLAGADLNRLDLRNINFKYACLARCNLSGANLSYCCLERADLSHANLEGSQLLGIKALCANMEGALLKGCNMEDPAGSRAVMEGVNLKEIAFPLTLIFNRSLDEGVFPEEWKKARIVPVFKKGADLEGSNMAGVNLRVATLKNANLQNCDLRTSVLAGADLEGCDLSGSDLHEANLRGANLKDATFELMLTPLHMSQTIR